MDDQQKIVKECYDEAKSAYQGYLTALAEDYRFYMSDQWGAKEKEAALKKDYPALNLNYIKKTVDVTTGFQRQNKADIKVYPIEGADDVIAEVYTRMIKWILADKNAEFAMSGSFKDAVIGGIGWMHPCVTYDDDLLNGDIQLKRVSPFNMLIDPHFTELDLSDCDYIIRHARVSKMKLKAMYPDVANDIKNMSSTFNNDGIRQDVNVPRERGEHLNVVEFWHREYEKCRFVLNPLNPAEIFLVANDEEYNLLKDHEQEFEVIEHKIPVIKLTTVIEDKVTAFDGPSPYSHRHYPFIPIFGYFEPGYSDWTLKLQGVVRCMKDAQREKNKRRSQIMAAINTMPHSGWIVDKGAVDDISLLRKSTGAGRIIEKNPNKQLNKIQAPEVPASIMQLEMMFKDDIMNIGANPDLIGLMQDKGAPGITLQLRQKQGITALQELFDNMSHATRTLGRHLIELINEKYSNEKIQRILGNEMVIPEGFDIAKKNSRFDTFVDETINSPTYRMASLTLLTQLAQSGVQVPPDVFIELADIPKATKTKLLDKIAQQEQMAMQMQQMQMQAQMGPPPAQMPEPPPMPEEIPQEAPQEEYQG